MQIAPAGDTGGVGTTAGLTELALAIGAQAPQGPVANPGDNPGDRVALHPIAAADLPELLRILEPLQTPETVVRINQLVEETVQAAEQGRLAEALGKLAEAAVLDPLHAQDLPARAELSPLRAEAEQLLKQLGEVAHIEGAAKLGSAEQILALAAGHGSTVKVPHWETPPETLLQVARELFTAGGYANYWRASELMQATLLLPPQSVRPEEQWLPSYAGGQARSRAIPAPSALREPVRPAIGKLWKRAPLLVLLLAWLAAGVAGGLISVVARKLWPEGWIAAQSEVGFTVWALGFLALAGFGFYAQVRRIRWP
jgi:hypothetical protein